MEILTYTISGLHACNYYVSKPMYTNSVRIYQKKIIDTDTDSFVTSNIGFSDGVSVEFKEITSPQNKENLFSNLLGQDASVQSILIKENGIVTSLDEKIKVYIKIPEKYLDSDNLEVAGIGNLADRQINFIREGDYYTFYTDSSGEVVFSTNDFSYWFIVAVAVIVVIILGIIFLFILNPSHRARKTANIYAEKNTIKRIRKGY